MSDADVANVIVVVLLLIVNSLLALLIALIANRRWQKKNASKQSYRWGIFLGWFYGLLAILFAYTGVRNGNLVWFLAAAVYLPLAFFTTDRRKWAFLTLTILSFNVAAWAGAYSYMRKRKEGFWWSKRSSLDFYVLVSRGTLAEISSAITSGADALAKNKEGLTPLDCAALFNPDPDVIRLLVKAGADVRPAGKGEPVLKSAAQFNPNPEVVAALIDAGAELEARGSKGWTPLMNAAADNKNPEMITTLLKRGAILEAHSPDGVTPLMCAASNNSNPRAVEILLAAGADVKAVTNDGVTALEAAATTNKNPEIVSLLLKNGSDVNHRDRFGGTPLIGAAANNQNPQIITILLGAGADAKIRTADGKSASDLAMGNQSWINTDVFEQLKRSV